MSARFAKHISVWLLAIAASAIAYQPSANAAEPLVFEDQFAKRRAIDDLRGDVVVLIYSDRGGAEASRELGEKLHVMMHPTAKGKDPKVAMQAPVRPLANQPPGAQTPDAKMIPLACIGDVPNYIRPFVRSRFRSVSPDAVVWLDLNDTMRSRYTLTPGVPNLIVFDTQGRERHRLAGVPDDTQIARLGNYLDALRAEGIRSARARTQATTTR
ncbi:MAG: hypothetical protein DWQ37_09180 [Planctomycetota bacterium]|nr:MAG: hypothetical protein DWQ37_09180 [Planctomycetota bacterium]